MLYSTFKVFANMSYEVQPSKTIDTNWTNIYDEYYLFEYDGELYYIDNSSFGQPVKYNEKEFDFFVKSVGADEYIKLEDGYMASVNPASRDTIFIAGDSWKGYSKFYINFYDNEYNLISQYNIGSYIEGISFYNGKYYCAAYSGYKGHLLYESTDKTTWVESNDNITNREKICNDIIYRSMVNSNEVSFDNGLNFYKIIYENKKMDNTSTESDIPLIIKYTDDDMFVSKDNVYFIDIPLKDLGHVDTDGMGKTAVQRWYFTNTHFVIDSEYYNKIKIPKQELEDALNQISYSPYVLFNNKYYLSKYRLSYRITAH